MTRREQGQWVKSNPTNGVSGDRRLATARRQSCAVAHQTDYSPKGEHFPLGSHRSGLWGGILAFYRKKGCGRATGGIPRLHVTKKASATPMARKGTGV